MLQLQYCEWSQRFLNIKDCSLNISCCLKSSESAENLWNVLMRTGCWSGSGLKASCNVDRVCHSLCITMLFIFSLCFRKESWQVVWGRVGWYTRITVKLWAFVYLGSWECMLLLYVVQLWVTFHLYLPHGCFMILQNLLLFFLKRVVSTGTREAFFILL